MTLRLTTIVLDVRDLKRATTFWCEALGYTTSYTSDHWVTISDPKGKGTDLGFQPRDDKKADVNFVHVDLEAKDVEKEVRRLEKLGAKRADWPFYRKGATHVVMLDPDGNEFCVVPS